MTTRKYVAVLGGLLAAGALIRLVVAFSTYGVAYDIDSLSIVGAQVFTHPGAIFGTMRWPYPGGFLPLAGLAHIIAADTGVPFHGIIQIPSIIGDTVLAALVAYWVGLRGGGEGERLGGAALVALGPSFIVISGFHGQIDAVAIAPAMFGVLLWCRGGTHRALACGLLIGLGGAVKTVPLFLLLALLPSVRDRAESVRLLGAAAVLPLVSILPLALGSISDTGHALTMNHGLPGIGGPSLFVQPTLIDHWLYGTPTKLSTFVQFLLDYQNVIVAMAVLAAGSLAYMRRIPPLEAACLIWLAVYVANPNWEYQFLVWGLPFFLAARRLREVALLQLALLLPTTQIYFHWTVPTLAGLYVPMMFLIWAAMAIQLTLCVCHLLWPDVKLTPKSACAERQASLPLRRG